MMTLLVGVWNILVGFWVVFVGFIGITITLITSFYYLLNALFKVGVGFYQIFRFMIENYLHCVAVLEK